MTQFFQSADGLRLAYDDQGSGHPILCLAGLSRNMADFEPVLERFADSARIIRLDSRGRGQSDWDPDYLNYTVPQEAQDALALLDHLGLDKVTILGTSRGGLIAMGLAAAVASRLHGVILNDIGPDLSPQGLTHIMGYLGNRPGYRDYDEAATRLPDAMAPAFRNVSHDQWRAYARRLWRQEPDGLDLRYDPRIARALVEQSAAGEAPDLWPLFDALAQLPVGLIRGANSDLLLPETATEMVRRHPGLIYGEVPDRGHVPFLDEPEAVGVIQTYLEQIS
ncbi:alpha/beta fold hydrolase [Tropicimonas isoalkanivorans]|uniref:Pimeloyl-ACP methyl ester carboxylesterase n=1 Tax=Tropicimonas isoalkanivorans TaxID=441112 RepID=A0A1I1IHU2_9RHOB|nr:alpha/beta hydrolase [Tropicimonas isoalkanivorans]SFC35765.1 Pimeloyl-ACP methyl ester carboxylesterase [Tropicimonas isoalkanivorans]